MRVGKGALRAVPTSGVEWWARGALRAHSRAPAALPTLRVCGLATRCARGLPEISRPFETEGAGNAGCPMHPQPGAHWVVKYAHQYSQRRHRNHPAFPTQWF
jgi:hypothetical protein